MQTRPTLCAKIRNLVAYQVRIIQGTPFLLIGRKMSFTLLDLCTKPFKDACFLQLTTFSNDIQGNNTQL